MSALTKRLLDRFRSYPLVRVVGGMMALTLVGQGLYVLAGPFIGRIYSPEEIGYYGLFATVVAVLGLFACGLYDLAIPAAKDDDEARRLGSVCMAFGATMGILAGLGFAAATAFPLLGLADLPAWSGLLVGAAVAAQAWVLLGQGWAIRNNDVLLIGQAHVLMNGVRSVLQVAGGFVLPLWTFLAASEVLARGAQAARLARSGACERRADSNVGVIKSTLRSHKRFPLIFGPAFTLDAAATLLQTGMIGALFGASDMGQYFLMRRTLDLPVAFAFRSLSDALFARQLSLTRETPEKLVGFFIKTAGALALGGAVFSWPLLIWGPDLFKLFYGPEWGVAGGLAAIMIVPIILNLAVAPVARIFQLSSAPQLRLVPSTISVAGSLLLLWVAHWHKLSFVETVIGIALVTTVHYIAYFLVGIMASKRMELRVNDDQ